MLLTHFHASRIVGAVARQFAFPTLTFSSVLLAEDLLCGDTVRNTERQMEPAVLAIICGQLVGAGGQFLQLGDGLVVKSPIVPVEPIQKPFSQFRGSVHCVPFSSGDNPGKPRGSGRDASAPISFQERTRVVFLTSAAPIPQPLRMCG